MWSLIPNVTWRLGLLQSHAMSVTHILFKPSTTSVVSVAHPHLRQMILSLVVFDRS